MKIRNGFVSNSSSASFIIPSFLLTEEQKELLLSLDDDKETKAKMQKMMEIPGHNFENSKNDYKKNKEYHKIYQKMDKNGEWGDSWTVGENKEYKTISGSSLMDNGCMIDLMKRIGIDPSIIEFQDEGVVSLAMHPKAVKHFSDIIDKEIEEFNKKPATEQMFEEKYGLAPISFNPYKIRDDQFQDHGYRLEYHVPYDERNNSNIPHIFVRKKV